MNKQQSLVPKLESCKKLAEHVELETYFGWYYVSQIINEYEWHLAHERDDFMDCPIQEQVPAPTTAELLNALPGFIEVDGDDTRFCLGLNKDYCASYAFYDYPFVATKSDTPSQALCSLLLTLLEEGIITTDDLTDE